MKITQKRPPFLEVDNISEPKVLPLTTNNMFSSHCFAFPPVTTDIEYVPFDRVYYENQPVKTIQYVSVAKKVIDYMPIERKRPCYSPGRIQQYSMTPMNRSAVPFQAINYQNRAIYSGNGPFKTPQNLNRSVFVENSPVNTQENRGVYYLRDSPLNIQENRGIYVRNSPLNSVRGIYVRNSPLFVTGPQMVNQNIVDYERNDMVKRQHFVNETDEKNVEFERKEGEFVLNEEKIIVEMQNQEKNFNEIFVEEEDLLLPRIVKNELVCLEEFVYDIVNKYEGENNRIISEEKEIKEQVQTNKEENLKENYDKVEENDEKLEIARKSDENQEEKPLEPIEINEINENYLLELESDQNEAFFPSKTTKEPQFALRISQGIPHNVSFVPPNRLNSPMYLNNQIIGRNRLQNIENVNKANIIDNNSRHSPSHSQNFVVNNNFQRLQSIENVQNNGIIMNSTMQNQPTPIHFIRQNPFQRLQTIETVQKDSINFNNLTNSSNFGANLQINSQNLTLNQLNSLESPMENRFYNARLLENQYKVDFGLISQLKSNPSPKKLVKIEEAPKMNKVSNRVLMPPIRQGGIKNTFQMPTLRQTNNEHILEALRNQAQTGAGGVNYYVSPYLAGYLKN